MARVYVSAEDAALAVSEIVGGEDEFLGRAYTRVSVRRSVDGWAVRVEYRKPERWQVSP